VPKVEALVQRKIVNQIEIPELRIRKREADSELQTRVRVFEALVASHLPKLSQPVPARANHK
jgi:hypothetical protein